MKTKTVSIALNLIDLSASGFWFCLSEQRVTEREEDQFGMGRCKCCGSAKLRWNAPIFNTAQPDQNHLERYRIALDSACNLCQERLRAAVEHPCTDNLDRLTQAIARAHGALSDLQES